MILPFLRVGGVTFSYVLTIVDAKKNVILFFRRKVESRIINLFKPRGPTIFYKITVIQS